MSINIGTFDRILRAALGALLLWLALGSGVAAFDGGAVQIIAGLIGLVLLVTAALRICPLYALFGIRTCKVRG